MKLSPVQYIAAGSHYAKSIKMSANFIAPGIRSKDPAEYMPIQRAALDVVRYSKNYEGNLKRVGKKTIPNYRYYDEREWRFVPEYSSSFPMLVPIGPDFTSNKKKVLNRALLTCKLDFDPSDIKYIVVKSDSEISEFIETIKSAKGKNYSHAETERLTTRILTREQIESDF